MTTTVQPLYPEDALLPGVVLNGYTIRKVLGRGAFGITYLAEEAHLERLVAIKEYLPEIAALRDRDNEVRARTGEQGRLFRYGLDNFLAEAKTLVKFNNPNIVRVLTYFTHYGTAYLVMEYEVGMDLNHFLKKNPFPGEDALVRIFSPINKGLAAVHANGYIHRDIKADNIYIREDNSPVLLDFGAARSVISNDLNQLTRILTVGYAPYEQDNPTWAEQGPWTDIYALGATLYYCVTGKRPVSSTERAGAIISNQKDPLPSAISINPPGYSLNFLAAIDKALRFKPEERPQTIEEWDDMLNRPADDATIIAMPTPEITDAPKVLSSHHGEDNLQGSIVSPGPTTRKSPASGLLLAGLLIAGTGAGIFLFMNIAGKTSSETSALAIVEQNRPKPATIDPATAEVPEKSENNSNAPEAKPIEADSAKSPPEAIEQTEMLSSQIEETTASLNNETVAIVTDPGSATLDKQAKTGAGLEQSKSLVLSTLVLAKTACWHYARGQKISELIEKIKALPETSDRTKFIVDQNRKLNETQSGFETNFAQYNQSLEKLRSLDKNDVELAVEDFFRQPQYQNDQTYRKLGDALLKHTNTKENDPQFLKDDLITISTSGVFSES